MEKFAPTHLLVPLLLALSTNCAIADDSGPVYTTVAANFTTPYNLNYNFKMNTKENIPYLTTITQGNNGKTLKLWQMQEIPNSDSVNTKEVSSYPIPMDQDPKNLHLALSYIQNNSGTFSNQYMAYIDKNHQNSLVILQTYSNGIRTLINENYPMKNIDAMDMAVEKDGNLIVATIDHSRHVHLYKYITQFSGQIPIYTTLIGNDSLVAPYTANPDQLKLALMGPDEVPYIVFPYTGTDKNPAYGRMAAAYATTWNPNAENSSTWSTPSIANLNGSSVNGGPNSPIDILASPIEDKTLYIAFHTTLGNLGIANFTIDKDNNKIWNYAYTMYASNTVDRYPIITTDGKSIFGTYAQSFHNRSYTSTTGRLFTLNLDSSYYKPYIQEYPNIVSKRSYLDTIKYTGLVMHSQNYPSHYLGFVLTQDGNENNSNNLIIKGITYQKNIY